MIILFRPRTSNTTDDAGISVKKIQHPPPYVPGPYAHTGPYSHPGPYAHTGPYSHPGPYPHPGPPYSHPGPHSHPLPFVPSLSWFCIKHLAPYPDQVHSLGHIRLNYHPPPSPQEYNLLRALVPNYDQSLDPRLWATIVQIYDNLPSLYRTYSIPLSDEHLPLLQRIHSTPRFSLVTVLDLPACKELTDDTIVHLRALHSLCAFDASHSELTSYGIKALAGSLQWDDDETPPERRGPWPLRILSLRNCVGIDNGVFPHLHKFILLSVIDLRGTGCNPHTSFPPSFRVGTNDALYYPSSLSESLSALHDAFPTLYSSQNPFTLHIRTLSHPRIQPPPKCSIIPQNTYVIFPPSEGSTSVKVEQPGDAKPHPGRGRFCLGDANALFLKADSMEKIRTHAQKSAAGKERRELLGMRDSVRYESASYNLSDNSEWESDTAGDDMENGPDYPVDNIPKPNDALPLFTPASTSILNTPMPSLDRSQPQTPDEVYQAEPREAGVSAPRNVLHDKSASPSDTYYLTSQLHTTSSTIFAPAFSATGQRTPKSKKPSLSHIMASAWVGSTSASASASTSSGRPHIVSAAVAPSAGHGQQKPFTRALHTPTHNPRAIHTRSTTVPRPNNSAESHPALDGPQAHLRPSSNARWTGSSSLDASLPRLPRGSNGTSALSIASILPQSPQGHTRASQRLIDDPSEPNGQANPTSHRAPSPPQPPHAELQDLTAEFEARELAALQAARSFYLPRDSGYRAARFRDSGAHKARPGGYDDMLMLFRDPPPWYLLEDMAVGRATSAAQGGPSGRAYEMGTATPRTSLAAVDRTGHRAAMETKQAELVLWQASLKRRKVAAPPVPSSAISSASICTPMKVRNPFLRQHTNEDSVKMSGITRNQKGAANSVKPLKPISSVKIPVLPEGLRSVKETTKRVIRVGEPKGATPPCIPKGFTCTPNLSGKGSKKAMPMSKKAGFNWNAWSNK